MPVRMLTASETGATSGRAGASKPARPSRKVPLRFREETAALYGLLHRPEPAPDGMAGLVICAPFADEAVHAHRVLAELAGRLAEAGIAAFCFDYTGTGDSEAGFDAGGLTRYVADIHDAVACLRRQTGVKRCGLVGLRLGANLAMRAAAEDPSLSPLVLWAPLPDLRHYFRGFLRLRLFTEVATAGRATSTVRALEERLASGGAVDVLGYPIGPEMAREFLRPGTDPAALPGRPTLVVELRARTVGPAPGGAADVGLCEPGVSRRRLTAEPFWERARAASHAELFETTVAWLAALP